MKRNRRENIITQDAASAIRAVKEMIEIIHGKCELTSWTFDTSTDEGLITVVVWGNVIIHYIGTWGGTFRQVKFYATVFVRSRFSFFPLPTGHTLEVADKNYSVEWDMRERMYKILRCGSDVCYVGTDPSYRWTEPQVSGSNEGLSYDI